MKRSEVFRKAADVIRERGWCQGYYQDGDGRVCIATAIHYASGGKPIEETFRRPREMDRDATVLATDAFLRLVVVVDGEFWWPRAETFNNEHCVSADDAIAALEIAADLAA